MQEALKRAENEGRVRAERVAELKRLEAAAMTMGSDITKAEELMEECSRYRTFLVSIVPPEWLQQCIAARYASVNCRSFDKRHVH